MSQDPSHDEREWQIADHGSVFDDPLLDCLVVLAQHHGRPLSHEALRAGLPLTDEGLTPELFVRAAERHGFSARILKRKLTRIDNLLLPAVLILSGKKACILLEIDRKEDRLRIVETETGTGEHWVDRAELEQRYLGYAIFVRSQYRFDQRTPDVFKVKTSNWFWGTLGKSWRIYRDVLLASFLVNLFALASPLFVMNVYDRVVPNNAFETLWVLSIGVAIVFGFDLLMRALRGYFIDLAGKKAEILLSAEIFERVLGLKMSHKPASAGAFASNLREFDSVREFITSATITTLIDLPFAALFLLVIWFIGGPIALVPGIGIPIVLLYSLFIQPALKRSIENTFRMSAQRNATLIESLIGLEAVKTLGAEGQMQQKWENSVAHISKWAIRSRLISSSAMHVAIAVQHFVTVGIVVYGVYLVSDGLLSLGGLIACVILSGRALTPMGQVASLASRYNQAKAALQALGGVMALPQERPPESQFVNRPILRGGIEFKNVSFTYPGQNTPALNNVSFRIRPNEKVAIIGRIGSGKSTIEKLIIGLHEPDAGSVLIDGVDIRQIDPADLRRNIGYAPQDTTLFFGTVRENLTVGAPHVDDATVLTAAARTGVTEFVDSHPSGFDMEVGERGTNLSGGQRQAIALGRALLLDPPVLLLDEPTNSMDNSTEELIKRRLGEDVLRGKTLLLVTHRASLSALVDRIIVMDSGRIIADGPKATVMEALKDHKISISRPANTG
ncbi:MAG: type I secretion system permease/ATPase [Candidatus Sedimenticola endophacoides]|uniref:Type I secretion system permease/ATPase n=1 Tax=Candidatus Sedimenticola endophacoides TaxID=2548426 RepID=A0A657Q4A5_9GAMM|nr:MAG: type I secretion system permease/ATPase [Candidatus Sedimenticola endophacoides]OQX42962.1 MAG: type I secretion system permease/ATPase [Candidatus Sedimenticola endophacoides]OQX43778.1 MAG: type I secretion system permease/ATPase [Candidatus Sedimenticola endophacoides]OQX46743.1 MAG: type I secretion system permease/ATPase [Candidatus Sedimenticola endophacoides]OQX47870.1 MAG: type I secretion system permease/ATPase [Candidatus Sedimenticola endophacoides]